MIDIILLYQSNISFALQFLLVGGVTQTTACAVSNNNNNAVCSSQQLPSRHQYPNAGAKSSNYAMYKYGSNSHNDNIPQQSHRNLTSNNYSSTLYHLHQRTSHGPYITQVTIRDNQHIIQSPNIWYFMLCKKHFIFIFIIF